MTTVPSPQATQVVSSWGNIIRGEHTLLSLQSRFDSFPRIDFPSTLLPFGNGRSYGDSCLNIGGALMQMRSLDRIISFDSKSGVLQCESGVLLEDILKMSVPAGWFLRVVPGTQFVTVGGAIANDVHGKNHHRTGTFGRHVRRLELLRSTGERLICSPNENADVFQATIGGLGLTGVITWAELDLRPIVSPWMDVQSVRFANLDEFFELSTESDTRFEYTVSWIDCLARDKHLGRGILQRADHADATFPISGRHGMRLSIPCVSPVSLVSSTTLRMFNTLYYHRQRARVRRTLLHYQKFFFPLDGIRNWNYLYGPRGFYQYQCVIPTVAARTAITELLRAISQSNQGSFLSVLKNCGSAESPGMLSFPIPGVTLALDFPNRQESITKLFRTLDAIVLAAGGRLYPAKDCRMPPALFRSGYPRWQEFSRWTDSRCSSNFWRRVTAE